MLSIVEATIRQVAAAGDVRALKVDVPELWSQAQTGWNETVRGFPLARTNGNFYVDPIDRHSFEDFPYRTTLSFNGTCWEQVERCRPLAQMEDRCKSLGSMGTITILTSTVLSADEIGYIVCTDYSQQSSRFLYPAAAPASSAVEPESLPDPQPVPGIPIDQNMEPARVPNPAFEAHREGDANPVAPREILIPQQGPPALPQGDVVGVQQNSVMVDGVALTVDSSIASLRAGCKHVGLSQSGSKSKLFRRLVSHFEQKQLEVIYALIPAIVMSGLYSEVHVIGALDISDAYLQVPQESKRRLKVVDAVGYDALIIAKCLPGQRDCARRWYFFFLRILGEAAWNEMLQGTAFNSESEPSKW